MAGDQLFVCFFSEVSVKMYSWTPGFLFVSFLAAKNHSFLRFPEASLPNFGSLTQDSSSGSHGPTRSIFSLFIYIFFIYIYLLYVYRLGNTPVTLNIHIFTHFKQTIISKPRPRKHKTNKNEKTKKQQRTCTLARRLSRNTAFLTLYSEFNKTRKKKQVYKT